MTNMFGITWASSSNLLLVLPVLCGLIVLLVYRVRKSIRVARKLSNSALKEKFLVNFSSLRLIIKALLFGLGSLFLCASLLRPQWNNKEEIVVQQGRDLFIALDVSRSMLAKDCLPNRLACAKKKIKELVKKLSCERIGLLLFSGTAFVRCPLTTDYKAFFMFLDEVDVETIASGTTALDQVIKKVIEAYQSVEGRKTKLLVILTDGEDFSSNLQQVKKQAQEVGMTIFTFGVGTTEGAPIPVVNDAGKQVGHIQDKNGSVVISRLNETILHTLAQDCGGMYIRMTHDDTDVRSLVKQVTRFEKERIEDKKFARPDEQYPYFLAASFAFFVMEWLL